jgi:hypothetical protein
VPKTSWTAKTLATETFHLLRTNPLLAVPVILADLLAFAAMHLQHALQHPLFTLLLGDKTSVLSNGGNRFTPTYPDIFKAAVIAAPLLWGTYWLSLWLYTTALATVSALIHSPNESQITLANAYAQARTRKAHIFRFSLCLLGGAILAVLALFGVGEVPWLFRHLNYDVGLLLALLIQTPLIFFLAPRALQMIAVEDAPQRFHAKTSAISAGLITVVTQMIIQWLFAHAIPPIFFRQTTIPGFLLREALTSLLGALPYIPFFIALSLLASDQHTPLESNLAPLDGPITPHPTVGA